MAWHNRRSRTREPQERSALGDNHVEAAISTLQTIQKRAVATLCSYDISRERTLEMIFPGWVLENARGAKNIIDPASDITPYNIAGANLFVNFDEHCPYPAIMPEQMLLQPSAGPLVDFISSVKAVHEQYEEVKHLLRWFNRHATPAGIRYYWPTVLQLCGKAPALADLQHVPARYTTPQGLPDRIQLIKDTAATMAASLMLPNRTLPPRGVMWLTFNPYHLTRDAVAFNTDQMMYFF